jgi:hypothetical protein
MALFTRPVTPARDRMDEHKRSVIGFQRQRLILGSKRRHIDQSSHAILAGDDLAAGDQARQLRLLIERNCAASRGDSAIGLRVPMVHRRPTKWLSALPQCEVTRLAQSDRYLRRNQMSAPQLPRHLTASATEVLPIAAAPYHSARFS